MNNIFQTLLYQREKQKDTVLATIVWDDGSAPRGAGSQMLVGAEGLLSGTIGGGAVELRSIQLARALWPMARINWRQGSRSRPPGPSRESPARLPSRCSRPVSWV